MGLNNKICEHPFAYCKSKRVFLSREDVKHKKCYDKESFDMIGTCKCSNLVERRAILKIKDYFSCYGYLKNIQNRGGISTEEFEEIWNYIEIQRAKLHAAEFKSTNLSTISRKIRGVESECRFLRSKIDKFLAEEREEQNNAKANNTVRGTATKETRSNSKHRKHGRRTRDNH